DASVSTDSAPGGGQIGALLLDAKYIAPGTTDTAGSYNHYSALRSYEDLLGLTTGGTDGEGHLGFAAAPGPGAVRQGRVSPGLVEPALRAAEALPVGDVLRGRELNHLEAALALPDGGGDADGQCARRHFHPVGDDCVGPHRGTPSDHGVMEDDR